MATKRQLANPTTRHAEALAKADRRAAALRENLKKRKLQIQQRVAAQKKDKE